mmetsp:Transcript_21008/g.36136  ORF Transcript_21008/g.36136 Transcript_21008/m.36136 type:complete len:411 (-) Transcript_21008:63-1295(-)
MSAKQQNQKHQEIKAANRNRRERRMNNTSNKSQLEDWQVELIFLRFAALQVPCLAALYNGAMDSQKRNMPLIPTTPFGTFRYLSTSSSPIPTRPFPFPANQFRSSGTGDILSPSSIESSSLRPLRNHQNDSLTPRHNYNNQPYRPERQLEYHQHQEGREASLLPPLSPLQRLNLTSSSLNRISIPNLLVEDLSPRQCVQELKKTIVTQQSHSMDDPLDSLSRMAIVANQDKNDDAQFLDDLIVATAVNGPSSKRYKTGSFSGNDPNSNRTSFEFVKSLDQSAAHEKPEAFAGRPPRFQFQKAAEISPSSIRLWTPEEDEILQRAVKEYGVKNWVLVSRKCFDSRRTGSQIRSRYLNVLHPCRVKQPWTPEEDQKLKELHQTYGNQWTVIAANMPNRVANDVKNRFRKFAK